MAITKQLPGSTAPDGSLYVTIADGSGNLNPTAGFSYSHISGAGTTAVKATSGVLHNITVSTAATTVTVYDNTTAVAPVIAVIGAVTGTFTYDISFSTALTIVVVGASADLTVSYK
jgi:hypothetical protein